jgi:hypothetical protein
MRNKLVSAIFVSLQGYLNMIWVGLGVGIALLVVIYVLIRFPILNGGGAFPGGTHDHKRGRDFDSHRKD